MQRTTLLLTFAVAIATLLLVTTGWAVAQPPVWDKVPVPQEIGWLDGTWGDNATENAEACNFCHSFDNLDSTLADRHHLLYGESIRGVFGNFSVPNPDADGDGIDDTTYVCLSCHIPDTDGEPTGTGEEIVTFRAERDCTECHKTGHHRTNDATNRKCSECHGDLVDDYDDGHYIPTYNPSLVTPFTGLWRDGYYDDGTPETQNTGLGVLDTPAGNYPGEAGRGDTHASNANRAGLIVESTGTDNNIHIDWGGRYASTTFTVAVVHLGGISPPTAAWSPGGGEGGTLTITFDPGVTTANEMIAVIEDLHGTPSGNEFFAEPDHSQGEGTGLFEPEHYEPDGGLPLNSRGYGAGACNYCHDASLEGEGLIVDNHDTHHGIDLGIGTGSDVKAGTPDDPNPGGTWRKCNICHDYRDRGGTYHDNGGATFALHIRICEECHGPDSLHNIQGDSPNPANIGTVVVGGEEAGYGHVGRDAGPGDSDCWGCHGFATASLPDLGPIVPTIYMADRSVVQGGQDTKVVLDGAAFTNTTAGTQYESKVTLTAADGSSVILTPDSVDEGKLTVTIPGGTAGGNYRLQAVKDDVASNPTVISVVPELAITKATSTRRGTVVITGSGFSGYAAGSGTAVTATAVTGTGRSRSTVKTEGKIRSWTDNKIVATFDSVPSVVTVKSVFGTKSYAIRSTSSRPTRR